MTGGMTGPPPPAEPGPARRGLEIAREALAAARAEARRRGARPGARRSGDGSPSASGSGWGSGWRARRAGADQRSGAHPDERDPQPLTAAVDRLLAERGWETDAAVGGAMAAGPRSSGPPWRRTPPPSRSTAVS